MAKQAPSKQSPKMTTNIYILRLQGGRYYVGKTADTARRYQEHLAGTGAAWTKKYKPVALERVIPNASPFDEDRYVKELMAKHGIDKVRGGAYVSEELDEIQEEALRREIWGAANKCTLCGRAGHFVKDCYARTDVEGNEILSESESDCSSRSSRSGSPKFYNPFYSLRSIAKKQVATTANPWNDDELLRSMVEEVEVEMGLDDSSVAPSAVKKVVEKRVGAIQAPSPIKKVVEKRVGAIQAPSKCPTCYRCGRTGHYASYCYARTHIKGYGLDSDSD